MKRWFKMALLLLLGAFCLEGMAQSQWRDTYKAKKKDTLYGIAKKYGISVDELIEANPIMKIDGYQLKKNDIILIPYAKGKAQVKPATKAAKASLPYAGKTVRVGIMLPLHNVDGDGRRMTEYYRGILMAVDDLKDQGLNTDIHAWNVNIDADITKFMRDPALANRDIIFGPLYTKQVHALAEFCKARNIKMVIPFSISGDDVALYKQIFQVYQSTDRIDNSAIESFMRLFSDSHPVFVDCNDKTSNKGGFTFSLRTRLDAKNIKYGITNISGSDDTFAKQFVLGKTNVVVLNTARSPELTTVIKKLETLRAYHPEVKIKLFGYTEWLMYLGIDKEKFHRFDTYIPSTFYYNATDSRTTKLSQSYTRWFHQNMQQALPRFAITGYDHGQFFLRGLAEHGKKFKGYKGQINYRPLQSPLVFHQIGSAGMQNSFFELIHFNINGNVEAVTF